MKFNLDDLNPAAWFDHPEHKARIQVRVLPVEELEKIRKKTVKRKIEYRRGQRFEVEKVDEEQSQKLTWDYCIVNWEGILDHNEAPIECTTENKLLLMRGAPKFAGWVTDCIDQLNQDAEERQESAEKN
jgi:hypothetical protein